MNVRSVQFNYKIFTHFEREIAMNFHENRPIEESNL